MKTFCKAVATVIERTPRKSLPAHHFVTVGEDVFAVVRSTEEMTRAMNAYGGNVTGYAFLHRM
jgi:hypothetical protein